jgi:hypothetical protein
MPCISCIDNLTPSKLGKDLSNMSASLHLSTFLAIDQ